METPVVDCIAQLWEGQAFYAPHSPALVQSWLHYTKVRDHIYADSKLAP